MVRARHEEENMSDGPAITTFDRDVSAAAVVAELESNGCAIVAELADDVCMQRLYAELQPYLDEAPFGQTEFAGRTSRRRNGLLAKSDACRDLAIDPLVLAVCDGVLGSYCVNYRLHVTLLVELMPGEVRQEMHRDGGIYPVRHPAPPMTLAAFWAYTDFTERNGATLVAPGSHRWLHEREPEAHELVQAVMSKGSILLYTSSVWHGSEANRSGDVRTGMGLHYNLGWLRQEENQVLSSPPDVARHFPERLQRLIGYDLGGPYLGFVEQGNPIQLLSDGDGGDFARTEPELDARRDTIEPILFGNVNGPQ
ncbi:MAG: ectoine hydroxylase-related dioxygenase (phytanoyl-CoA dioxygenase family) [Candidatus Poriferisodalaceae bacterium]|jgi:ectoine hydroxylase-related dioxygenase (phytanoyl-CoA dioxygenase family)